MTRHADRFCLEDFLAHVEPDLVGGCWLWAGHERAKGYGGWVAERRTYRAHRASWILHFGDIAGDLFVCHKCDVRACVNPAHLWLGSNSENMKDAYRKGRITTLKQQLAASSNRSIQIRASRLPRRTVRDVAGCGAQATGGEVVVTSPPTPPPAEPPQLGRSFCRAGGRPSFSESLT